MVTQQTALTIPLQGNKNAIVCLNTPVSQLVQLINEIVVICLHTKAEG